MVDQPLREKMWHKYNMGNGTPNLVAPTIDAQWEEACRPRRKREPRQVVQNNGVEPTALSEMRGKPDGGASSPRLSGGFIDRKNKVYE